MKRYQIIMPVALPLALFAGFVYMVQGRMTNNRDYESYIQAAQEYESNGVLTDAIAAYGSAIEIRPTLDAYLAIGDLYLKQEEYYEAERWYNNELLGQYPDEGQTYAFGIRAELAKGDARGAFSIYDVYNKRQLQDETVEEQMRGIWYSFGLSGSYDDVGGISGIDSVGSVKQDEAWGYVDTTGEKILPNIYQKAGVFGDLTAVVDADGSACFIDPEGNTKLTAPYFMQNDPDFGQIVEFADIQSDLVLAYNGKIWNYYDAESHEKLFGGYPQATVITNGVGAVSEDGERWALIARDGQILTEPLFREVVLDKKGVPCRTEAVIVRQNSDYLLVDRTGTPITGNTYEAACAFNDNSYAAVQKNGRWIFVNEKGEEKDLGDFEEAKSFSGGAAAVKTNGRWGYIDEEGTWIIEPQFYEADPFSSDGAAFVKTSEEKWQMLTLYRFHHE